MMIINSAIELHDSTISAISYQGSSITVHFTPAYIHKSDQRPGIDAGTGWIQDAKLKMDNASVHGIFPELPADIWDGKIVIGSEEHKNTIPLPFAVVQNIVIHIEFCTGDHVKIEGAGAHLQLLGECKYIEDFKP
jgi:hypothetical protein